MPSIARVLMDLAPLQNDVGKSSYLRSPAPSVASILNDSRGFVRLIDCLNHGVVFITLDLLYRIRYLLQGGAVLKMQ